MIVSAIPAALNVIAGEVPVPDAIKMPEPEAAPAPPALEYPTELPPVPAVREPPDMTKFAPLAW